MTLWDCHDFRIFVRRATRRGAMADQGSDGAEREMQPAADLLPVVYAELRRLAGALTGRLPPGQTLQPTALVHEAFLRLVGDQDPGWEGRRHFFGAAARAMRDILVEQARRKGAQKHGGGVRRIELNEGLAIIDPPADDILAVDEAIRTLQVEKPQLAELTMLRYYAGLSVDETAAVLGISASTLAREWRFARAWLVRQLGDASPDPGGRGFGRAGKVESAGAATSQTKRSSVGAGRVDE
jgi:RNA polymerase sigma factor (TIGR02999 family)